MVIDTRLGTARILGPMTREEQADLEPLREQKQTVARSVAALRRALRREADPDEQEDIRRQIKIGEELMAKYARMIGE